VPKELVWAGDGIQIWLQILYHVYRVKEFSTIVLDEPEVYLHPDLQRKLVHLLDWTGKQVVLATHSSEVASEAEARLIALVDKSHKRVRRARNDADLEWLSASLGTAFNLRLARALRSSVALFVEGKDMLVIKRFARTLGFLNLEGEKGITIIKLEGFSGSSNVTPFSWLCEELLPDALKVFVLLDRDYRSDQAIVDIEKSFKNKEIDCHVWRLKELESYLLTPSVIARLTGLSCLEVDNMINEITSNLGNDVFARQLAERIKIEQGPQRHIVNIAAQFKADFDVTWADSKYRLSAVPAKEVMSKLNEELQARKLRAVSARNLSAAHREAEIDPEMIDVLRSVDSAVDQ
jgi:predicted ATP-dependent endonuclease of OLD family